MIESDQINCITIAPEATSQEWMGFFIGIPSKQDVIDAIYHHIDKLVVDEVEHEQDEAEAYRVAIQVIRHSEFSRNNEEVSVAGVLVGKIKCDRLDCFNVTL